MRTFFPGSFRSILGVALLLCLGCGTKGPPGTLWVSGSVTLEGTSLRTGVVHFVPKDISTGDTGGALRIQGGRFGLFLKPGHYRLAVISRDGVEEIDAKTGSLIPPPSLIPIKYETVSTSGLDAMIDAEHRRIDIQLSK
jgi:hypothetical protein